MLIGEDQLNKRLYLHATTDTTTTAVYTSSTTVIPITPTTNSIATACKGYEH